MITIDELAAIPVLKALTPTQLADFSRVAADIHLNPTEYVVHEGEEAALYIVIDGLMEITKVFDGIERPIGNRKPGQIFGEVPLIFGTQFQSSCRAVEPSRVLRVEARQYYLCAEQAPEFAQTIRGLAKERIGGLQTLAAQPKKSRVVLLGDRLESACLALRRFLIRNQITFDWITPDDFDLEAHWGGPPPPEADCPVVRLADGTLLVKPGMRDLAERLGLQTEPKLVAYDTVIVGGGPAGLAAAVYGASEGLRTLVVEREAPGGQAGTSSRIENYLGFPSGISGDELASRALRQAKRLGAEVLVSRSVVGIDPATRTVTLDGDQPIAARTVIIATGVSWRQLAIDGFDRLMGKGIYYGAARSEAGTTQGLDIHLIGAGNSAGQAAISFANHAHAVTIICRGDGLEKSMSQYLVEQIRSKPNIRVALQSEVAAVSGDTALASVTILDRRTGKMREEATGGLFVFIGADAETDWLPPEIARDGHGYVLTGSDAVRAGAWHEERDPYLIETSLAGVFACGDVRLGPVKRVAAAVGEGSMAIAFVHQYLGLKR
jgi:thioredoxin reductase (NADPH)